MVIGTATARFIQERDEKQLRNKPGMRVKHYREFSENTIGLGSLSGSLDVLRASPAHAHFTI
jgi:hypothetical protein